jgi:hypothetical protein
MHYSFNNCRALSQCSLWSPRALKNVMGCGHVFIILLETTKIGR